MLPSRSFPVAVTLDCTINLSVIYTGWSNNVVVNIMERQNPEHGSREISDFYYHLIQVSANVNHGKRAFVYSLKFNFVSSTHSQSNNSCVRSTILLESRRFIIPPSVSGECKYSMTVWYTSEFIIIIGRDWETGNRSRV